MILFYVIYRIHTLLSKKYCFITRRKVMHVTIFFFEKLYWITIYRYIGILKSKTLFYFITNIKLYIYVLKK